MVFITRSAKKFCFLISVLRMRLLQYEIQFIYHMFSSNSKRWITLVSEIFDIALFNLTQHEVIIKHCDGLGG